MSRYLKEGKSQSEMQVADVKVREIVSGIIEDIEKNGEAAVRKYSEKFDKWSPASFRLTEEQIKTIVASVPGKGVEDIKFAQRQIRNFAEKQRASIQDIEVETLPGVILGHKNIPVNSAGCYIPGGRYPMVASAHMSILTAKVAGVKRVIGCTRFPLQRSPPCILQVLMKFIYWAECRRWWPWQREQKQWRQ